MKVPRALGKFPKPQENIQNNCGIMGVKIGGNAMDYYAATRTVLIKSENQLRSIDSHGRRTDIASKRRVDPNKTKDNLAWSLNDDDPLDVVGSFRKRIKETNAVRYGKSSIGMHMICMISPDWFKEYGDMHDPKNPANRRIFDGAKIWAERQYGAGSVIATRMDMDESGVGSLI